MTGQGPGQVLFHFVRHWSRRDVAADAGGGRGRAVLVCEAVHALERHRIPATVNAVAHELGIDQSGASRLITSATADGYLTRAAAPTDARRRHVALTSDGRDMLEQAHRWQEAVFAQLTTDWPDQRRRDFHLAMTDLMERSYEQAL